MIKARHNKFYQWFFHWYIFRILRRTFHEIKLIDCGFKPTLFPILAIGNHISWWDGFWMLNLNTRNIEKRFHILMLEEQLKPRMFLNKLGAAGMATSGREILTGLDYCSKLLREPENILFFFPEGEIRSLNSHHITFEKGIMRIIEHAHEQLQVLFVVNMVEYFSNQKPTLFTFYALHEAKAFSTKQVIEKAYNAFMESCRTKLINTSA